MTEKLFYQDSGLREFTAKVMSCQEHGKGWQVVLDRTAFFPEGGGQSGDRGYLEQIKVYDVQEKGDTVYHMTEAPLHPGAQVKGLLDYEARFSKMQQHTGEHIVSGLINRWYGYRNVGFHLGSELVTMDFNGELGEEDLRKVEWEANQAVVGNLPVEVSYPEKKVLETLEYRSKIDIQGQVRIVTIPGYDVCACCAPHVKRTGEVGIIRLTGASRYKGGTRVSMLCGFRALEDYREKSGSVSAVSVLLSAKPGEVAEGVQRLKEEIQEKKERMVKLQEKYLDLKLMQADSHSPSVYIFEQEMDTGAMRNFVNKGVEKGIGICGAFTGSDQEGYQYILGSRLVDLREYGKGFQLALQGKGGGKPEMIQGTVRASQDQIRSYLESERK